jgi:hypothetical protein
MSLIADNAKPRDGALDYAAALPYPSQDPQRLLDEIERGLANAVLLGDVTPGVVIWTKRLNT